MVGRLMVARRFAPLFWCQFFGAFGDNFVKNVLVILILFRVGGEGSGMLVTLAGGVFIAPFFFLSGLGGQWADRFDKAAVARRLKLVEIAFALIGAAGFWLQSVPLLFAALFLYGVNSALFGPIKYGILPDHLRRDELPAANALIEGATFLAILLGTIAGGVAAARGDAATVGALLLAVALACWLTSLLIPRTGEKAPDLVVDANIARSTAGLLRDLKTQPELWRGGLVVSWFWVVGAIALSLLPTLVKDTIGGTEEVVTAFLAVFAIAIAIGSMLASFLSSGRIVLLLVPVAAVLMAGFSLDLAYSTWNAVQALPPVGPEAFFARSPGLRVAIDLAGLAVAGGLFIVPIFSAVQAWAPEDRRARVIAGVNVLNAAWMVAGTLVVAGLQAASFGTPALFSLLGLANLLAAALIWRALPINGFRDMLVVLFRVFHRVEIVGAENLAKIEPGSVVVANHVSFLDGPLVLSLLDTPPVFALDDTIARRWWLKPFLRTIRALPLDPTKPLATRTLINTARSGETIVVFPEGRITVTGSLMKVYDGAGLVADKAGGLVVPVRIEGLEAGPLSRLDGRQVRKSWFPKVKVTVLEPVRLRLDPALTGRRRRHAAGQALYGIMSDLIYRTTPMNRTVVEAVLAAARREGPKRVALTDPVTGSLTYKRLLLGAAVLGRKLMPLAPEGGAVGVMLPNANGAAVTLLGLMSAGRVPAMINFTAGAANILSSAKAANVTTIVTSRAFVEKARLAPLVETLARSLSIVYLEDVRARIGLVAKLRGLAGWRRPLVRRRPDDPAAILFTSGSEGVPKGVVLSHVNMLANASQAAARIDFGRTDKVFNVLPVFHSFGLTVGLILPLTAGVEVYLYPSPLHYRLVPELVYGTNATILFGTDTFLTGYGRAAHPYDLRSVRYVLAGAEAVKDETRRLWMEKFGLRILEGYGVTETAPALALNTPMHNRFGTVGRLLPGMEARLEPVPGIDEGGRLHVRGPNVMLGYLKADRPGELQPPAGPDGETGWHDTGDIVTIDEDGFIAIKGRAKRFAKIGGEMISLAAVEALASRLWPDATSAVAAMPDARKGERLVMLTTKPGARRADILAYAREAGASELMVPAEVHVVAAMPLLGSGKLDFAGVTRLAREVTGRAPETAPAPAAAGAARKAPRTAAKPAKASAPTASRRTGRKET